MKEEHSDWSAYARLLAMIVTSMVVMYALTYLNSEQILGHARFSETRLFMTLMMGASMAAIMLAYMLRMYTKVRVNIAVFVGAALLFAAALFLVRSQITVTDVDYMEGMIPHHSIAILTSKNARIEDVRVQELANAIIDAQEREIREMDWLIEDIRANGAATSDQEAQSRPVPQF